MASLRSHLFLFLLKHRQWLRLQWKRPVIDFESSILDLRAQVEQSSSRLGKVPKGIAVTPAVLESPYAEWIRPSEAVDEGCILYLHGGGYVMGSARAHRAIVAKFVQGSGVGALVVDYRLAPEHPFPAALDDALTAYRWLLDQGIPASKIVLAGDSAGGGLCLAALIAARDRNIPLPAAAVALSPWTDLRCTGLSYQRRDPVAPDGSWTVYAKYYAGGCDPGDPLISPLYAQLDQLPPLFISVGEDEVLLDDATRLAAKARQAGVPVELHIGERMVHCYPVFSPLFPEATAIMARICAFIRSQVSP